MLQKTESTHPYRSHPIKTNASLGAHSNIFAQRGRDESGFRSDIPEDYAVYRRWRLGFFVFYGAIIWLLVGFATVADRPATLISAATQASPATASADSIRHRAAEGAMRE